MKKLLLGLPLVLAISSAQAFNTNSKYFAADQTVDSQLCFIAATQGLEAAVNAGKEVGGKYKHFLEDTSCNGTPIKAFAKKIKNKNVALTSSSVKLFPANAAEESLICMEALKSGIKSVEKKSYVKNVKCNGKTLKKFVKQYGKI